LNIVEKNKATNEDFKVEKIPSGSTDVQCSSFGGKSPLQVSDCSLSFETSMSVTSSHGLTSPRHVNFDQNLNLEEYLIPVPD